ncbi:MAG TPA: ABC transporter substrate-binding protein, partial [Gammaproteobacteria bacterium]|nr:ABC transporter substrate-binding protein [Gammaproteobacteria bacterium]
MVSKVQKLLRAASSPRARHGLAALMATAALGLAAAPAHAAKPIKIGVIAPASAIDGKSIFNGAELAAQQINANGGIDGRQIKLIKYDDHASASDGVRAFQRAARQDHVVAVVGNFISEVALAIEPWAARLKMPYVITGAASTKLNKNVGNHWPAYKYIYMENLNSYFLAKNVCDASHDILVNELHYKTAVIMRENAAWTKPLGAEYKKCLPEAGLKVLKEIVFSPDTNDFTPIYSNIKKLNPDVIITGIAHVGVKPTVQWHNQQVPVFLGGWSSQAGASTFWNATNGATEGVMTGNLGAGDAT